MRDQRSQLNFIVLIVVALATTFFVINKANEAIAEISTLNDSPAFLGHRNAEGILLDSSTWKTYHSEEYGFEIQYPPAWSISEIQSRNETPSPYPWYKGQISINFENPYLADLELTRYRMDVTKTTGVSLETWYATRDDRAEVFKFEPYNLNGYSAKTDGRHIFLVRSGMIYEFIFPEIFPSVPSEEADILVAQMKLFESTFKLLK